MDVAGEGIALYQADESELHQPKPKTPMQALAMATEYFEEWFPSALVYLKSARDLISDGRTKEPAFILQRSAERLDLAMRRRTPLSQGRRLHFSDIR